MADTIFLADKNRDGEAPAQHVVRTWWGRLTCSPDWPHRAGTWTTLLYIVRQGPTHMDYNSCADDLVKYGYLTFKGKRYKLKLDKDGDIVGEA